MNQQSTIRNTNMTFSIFIRGALTVALLFSLIGCGADGTPTGDADHDAVEAHDDHGEPEMDESHEEGGNSIELTAQEIQAEGIRIENIQAQKLSQPIAVTAIIEANQDRLAHVAPRVAARIINVTANLGDRVKKGQSLARLDSAEVGEAHAVYLQARSELDVARAAFERADKLQAQQIIAQKEYLRVSGDFERAAAAFRASENRLQILGVAPTTRTDDRVVSSFLLRSPFTGTIIEKHAILGELANPGKSLFSVADLSTLWIEADIYEKDLGRVETGSSARVQVAAYPDTIFQGVLTYLSDVMDAETRTVKARIELPNPEKKLKPQMFATAHIDTTTQRQVMVLPANAVTLIEGKSSVFVQEHDAFEVRPVQTGDRLAEVIVIESGISPEDRVVVEGAFALKARMLKSALGSGHAH
jgi:membrane fusion protein, heavy metal efflux system